MSDRRLIPPGWAIGEFFGTFLLVFFGCGSIAASVLTGAQVGIFQVAIVWGLGIATAIHLTASLSGAHLNPAVTTAMAAWAGFPWKRVPGYILAQLLGAFCASAVLYVVFSAPLSAYETAHNIVRGAAGSEASAMIFGEYFPNPGSGWWQAHGATLTPAGAFLTEAVGTAVLVLVVLGVSDERNSSRPGVLAPAVIGLTITMLISLFGPLTMAGFNPARDFAPRVFSALAGWGSVPFSANGHGWLVVYILAPLAGGFFGGAIYRGCFAAGYRESTRV
jgi:glycerol uptake facilitator protein